MNWHQARIVFVIAALVAAFLSCVAKQAGAETTVTVSTYDLYKGTKRIASYATAAECATAARQIKGKTQCRNIVTYVTTEDPPPVNPPVPPPVDHHAGVRVADPSQWPTPQPGVSDVLLIPAPVPPLPAPGDWEHDGAFRLLCNWSKMSFDDPIVYPGKPGAAHHHTFFGNTGIDAFTTSENIRDVGNATCRGGTINKSGYWIPSMIDTATGKPVAPKTLLIYYKTGQWPYMADGKPMSNLPKGLKMIAGDAMNAAPGGVGKFSCMQPAIGESRAGTLGNAIPNCLPGEELWLSIPFPQCWDGVNLDSPNHKSHMAYPEWNPTSTNPERMYRCPITHPVVLPAISFQVEWTIPGDTSKWRLASDVYDGPAGYSAHGDWMNGWDTAISDLWGALCMAQRRNCGSANLGDGRETGEFQGN